MIAAVEELVATAVRLEESTAGSAEPGIVKADRPD
jgi:hypothetical protein